MIVLGPERAMAVLGGGGTRCRGAATAEDTVLGSTFVYGWDAPGRTLRRAADAALAFPGDVVGEVPRLDGTREPLLRWYPEAITQGTTGTIEAMSLWALVFRIAVFHLLAPRCADSGVGQEPRCGPHFAPLAKQTSVQSLKVHNRL